MPRPVRAVSPYKATAGHPWGEGANKAVDLCLEDADVVFALAVLLLALAQSALKDLDLLVEQGQLIVAPDQLRAVRGEVAERGSGEI